MGKDEQENSSLHVGGVVFRACTINDDRQRDWFSCVWDGTHGHSTPPRLVNISGDVTIHNPALSKAGSHGARAALKSDDDEEEQLHMRCGSRTMLRSLAPRRMRLSACCTSRGRQGGTDTTWRVHTNSLLPDLLSCLLTVALYHVASHRRCCAAPCVRSIDQHQFPSL